MYIICSILPLHAYPVDSWTGQIYAAKSTLGLIPCLMLWKRLFQTPPRPLQDEHSGAVAQNKTWELSDDYCSLKSEM